MDGRLLPDPADGSTSAEHIAEVKMGLWCVVDRRRGLVEQAIEACAAPCVSLENTERNISNLFIQICI